ncbi:cell wall hydrolase [Pseudomonas arsenicoxydans]|uniref:Cell wall hydrolase SleB domain-containing protein n=1 Tax=Pseudomonas arsenicoxydans TaxID=702115 RepID=A0A502GNC1_9PSED|nr:hypothetical protein EAH78_32010 [Pseudomonas arsenicoxydans]
MFKHKQFFWTLNRCSFAPLEPVAWKKTGQIATAVIQGVYHDFTQGATHLHTTEVRPIWSKSFERMGRFSNHIFYTSAK